MVKNLFWTNLRWLKIINIQFGNKEEKGRLKE